MCLYTNKKYKFLKKEKIPQGVRDSTERPQIRHLTLHTGRI